MIPKNVKKAINEIKSLKVQGARNVAKRSVKEMRVLALKSKAKTIQEFRKEIHKNAEAFAKSRVTEPAMRNGMRSIRTAVIKAKTLGQAKKDVVKTADNYTKQLERAVKQITEIGAKRITDGDVIMTHCHSSTVMKILEKAFSQGKEFSVLCTETRPRFQGRITAKELLKAGIPTTMIVDSCARRIMNDVDLVLVGADAVTSEGYVINKIGTSQIALVAKEARTAFASVCETFKFDPDTLKGEFESIELRDKKEVWAKPPKKLNIYNPAFDATPPHLVDFIITEIGVIHPSEATGIIRDMQVR